MTEYFFDVGQLFWKTPETIDFTGVSAIQDLMILTKESDEFYTQVDEENDCKNIFSKRRQPSKKAPSE